MNERELLMDAAFFAYAREFDRLRAESSRLTNSAKTSVAMGVAVDAILAAGFHYSPPPEYHSCNPSCKSGCQIKGSKQ